MPDLTAIILAFGYVGLSGAVLFESGVIIGFFLPGDSLLFTAGFLASQHALSFPVLVIALSAAASLGSTIGYATGRFFGTRLFTAKESRFFKPRYVAEAHAFFLKYGARAIFLARFAPILRTFVPIAAGIALMPFSRFMIYNVISGIVWAGGVLSLGYLLGRSIPNAQQYLLPITLLIMFVSFLPALWHFWNTYSRKSRTGRPDAYAGSSSAMHDDSGQKVL